MNHRFSYKETNLNIKLDRDILDELIGEIIFHRKQLEEYIRENPGFVSALEPVNANGCEIVKLMAKAAKIAGVGPMAAVAGAISELGAKKAVELNSGWVLIDNGGDIAMYGDKEFAVQIYAGCSELSNKLGFKIIPKHFCGICTSSSSVGHSISFGYADAVVVIAKSAAIADATTTAIGNKVVGDSINESIKNALKFAKKIEEIDGVLIIREDEIGMWGNLPEIIEIKQDETNIGPGEITGEICTKEH